MIKSTQIYSDNSRYNQTDIDIIIYVQTLSEISRSLMHVKRNNIKKIYSFSHPVNSKRYLQKLFVNIRNYFLFLYQVTLPLEE